jgi:hypothetical protein
LNAKDMLIQKLKEIGADGLWNGEIDEICGCGIDDLAPCDNCNIWQCEAAKLNHEDKLYYPMEAIK